jgi:hypothetical protein
MSAPTLNQRPATGARARMARELAGGFLFWLAFLLALEPGNLVRASAAGLHPAPAAEVLRIVSASLFAAPTCPLIFWLAERFPARDANFPRNALLHAAVIGAAALTMIAIGQAAASWMPPTSIHGSFVQQLTANILLLIAAMAVMDAGAHLAHRRGRVAEAPPVRPGQITVTSRGRTVLIDVGELDWVEAQGNYLGLRAGGAVHLIRETLTRFQSRLDPRTFVRIHRGRIVNLNRVREVVALGTGDALLKLRDGAELRVSRAFAEALRLGLRDRAHPNRTD